MYYIWSTTPDLHLLSQGFPGYVFPSVTEKHLEVPGPTGQTLVPFMSPGFRVCCPHALLCLASSCSLRLGTNIPFAQNLWAPGTLTFVLSLQQAKSIPAFGLCMCGFFCLDLPLPQTFIRMAPPHLNLSANTAAPEKPSPAARFFPFVILFYFPHGDFLSVNLFYVFALCYIY